MNVLTVGMAVAGTLLFLNRRLGIWPPKETPEDVVHRLVAGAIERAVEEASDRVQNRLWEAQTCPCGFCLSLRPDRGWFERGSRV